MSEEHVAVVVLAAGMGTRMKSQRPKVMHAIAGRPMIAHLLETIQGLRPQNVVVVIGPGMDQLAAAVAPHPVVVQQERRGTGHAVAQAQSQLGRFAGTLLVVYGDTPLITLETLQALLARRHSAARPAVVVLGFRPADPPEYGRLIVGADGLAAIVEYGDATAEQRALTLCNSGVMAIDGMIAGDLLARLDDRNAKREFYLTDLVAHARAAGRTCDFVEGGEEELLGVNARDELARAEAVAQQRLRQAAMAAGATLVDPASVFFSWDTQLGRDVVVQPHVVFEPGVHVGERTEIRAFCHLSGVTVAADCLIGPFARLRPGAMIADGAHIGNFVEVKNASIEAGAKVNHLAYIGDARIGAAANIGAGTIVCNYDGYRKNHTDVGTGAFIGSNSSLVAPVAVGDGAIVGAGSVITRDVAAGALALGRGAQTDEAGGAARVRAKLATARRESPVNPVTSR